MICLLDWASMLNVLDAFWILFFTGWIHKVSAGLSIKKITKTSTGWSIFGFTGCSKAIKIWIIHILVLRTILHVLTGLPIIRYVLTGLPIIRIMQTKKKWGKQIHKLLCYMSNELRSRLVTWCSISLFKIASSLCLQLWKLLLRSLLLVFTSSSVSICSKYFCVRAFRDLKSF